MAVAVCLCSFPTDSYRCAIAGAFLQPTRIVAADINRGRPAARIRSANGTQHGDGELAPLDPRLRRLLFCVPLVLLVIIAIERLELTWHFPLTRMLMQSQDVPVLVPVCLTLLALAIWGVPAVVLRWGDWGKGVVQRLPLVLAMPSALAALVVALGTFTVTNNTPVTHDEIMATFDAEIIASGRIMAPIPPEWRSLSWTLKPAFRLPVPGDVAWVSTYLPGNAAIRGLIGKVFDPAVVNAILVWCTLLALLACARRLLPGNRAAQFISVLLAATSSQVLYMGMTPFAMTGHLLLNLVWLWLFLRNTIGAHVGAIGVGFVATGLHQLIFHPLFVAPFVLQILLDRRWRIAALYGVSYAAIVLFWIVYWQLLLAGYGTGAKAASSMGVSFFIQRVTDMLTTNSWSGVETMVQNLLRFIAWQHPLMLILFVPGTVLGWRAGGVLRALAGGIALTLFTMLILLPYQDIGWGYRYLHGLIGSGVLLAAFGWSALTAELQSAERQATWGVLAATTATALLLIAVHAAQVKAYIAPYTRANAAIAEFKEEAVVIETISIHNGIELIRNDPYLRKRPLTFDIGLFDEKLVRELCARMTVTVFDGARAARYGMQPQDPTKHPAYAEINRMRQLLESAECRAARHSGR